MHVDTIRRRHGDRVYESFLVRRSVREGKQVRKETLANISRLPAGAIEAVRRVLAGEALVSRGEALKIERSLPHGHVAAVLGTLRRLGLERIIASERCRERDLVVALVCQRLLRPGSKLSATRPAGADRGGARPPGARAGWLRLVRPLLQLAGGDEVPAGGVRLLARRAA